MQLRILFALLAALLLACETTPAPSPPAVALSPPPAKGACARLARAFYLVARNRERGASKEAQVKAAAESIDNPFTTQPDDTLRGLLRVIDLVYRRPDLEAREIEAVVLADCSEDERGQAVLRTLWPQER